MFTVSVKYYGKKYYRNPRKNPWLIVVEKLLGNIPGRTSGEITKEIQARTACEN